MIDVSNLTHLQAAVALLIERRGESGIRVCELCQEVSAAERSVGRTIAQLLASGHCIKIDGERPRYIAPTVESGNPTPGSPFFAENPGQLINLNLNKLNELIKGDFDSSFEPTTSSPLAEPGIAPSPGGSTGRSTAPSMPAPSPQTPPKGRRGVQTAPEPVGDTRPLPRGSRFDGTIYGSNLDRKTYLDRMLLSFDDIDRTVPNGELVRIGEDPSLIGTPPPHYFALCMKLVRKELYRTEGGYKLCDPLIREIYEELNQRLAFAIARRVSQFASWSMIRLFFDAMPQEASRKKRTDYVIFPVRDIFIEQGWGWESRLLDTRTTWSNELQRAARLGTEPRAEFFPIYDRLIRIPPPTPKKTGGGSKTDRPPAAGGTSAAPPEITVLLGDKIEEFKRAKLRVAESAFRITFGTILDPDRLALFLETAKAKSLELKSLSSAVAFGEATADLAKQGWRQLPLSPDVWYPPIPAEPNPMKIVEAVFK